MYRRFIMGDKKKYNAICLNINITNENIDDGTLMALNNILKRRVQVVLNAGDVNKQDAFTYVKENLIDVLAKKFNTSFEYLKSIAVMCEDGQRIICTSGMDKEYFDDEESYDSKDATENVIAYLEIPKENIMGLDNENVEDIAIAKWTRLSSLYPTICNQTPNHDRTTKKLAVVAHKIETIRETGMKETNRRFNKNFNVFGGIWDVFDKCGAIEFKDHEWELLNNNNPLKALFMEKYDNGNYKYSLETDNSRILRGSSTYYHFFAHKPRTEKKDLDADTAKNWYQNNDEFLNKASEALKFPLEYSNTDAKLLLGVMDNIRNLALITVNAAIMRRYMGKTIYVSLSEYKDDKDITESHEVCREVCEIMSKLCFERPLNESLVERVQEVISKMRQVYGRVFNDVLSTGDTQLYAKSFRDNREIDSFIENFITMDFAMKQLKENNPDLSKKDIYYSGICYGGLELPFLAEYILDSDYYNVKPSLITLQGDYKSRHEIGSGDMEMDLFVKGIGNTDDDYSVVADDLLTTGATVQTALNILFNNGYKVDNLMFVRYPTLNRIPQMLEDGHGSVDTRQFFSYIHGLLFQNPYSKIIRGNSYVDELKVFDKNENRILGWLGKNGDYMKRNEGEKSKVEEYMIKFEGKERKVDEYATQSTR